MVIYNKIIFMIMVFSSIVSSQVLVANFVDSVCYEPVEMVFLDYYKGDSIVAQNFSINVENNQAIYKLGYVPADSVSISTFNYFGPKIALNKNVDTLYQTVVFKYNKYYAPKKLVEFEAYQKRIEEKLLKNPDLVKIEITEYEVIPDSHRYDTSPETIYVAEKIKIEATITNLLDESIYLPISNQLYAFGINFSSDFPIYVCGLAANTTPLFKFSHFNFYELKSDSAITIKLDTQFCPETKDIFWVNYSYINASFFETLEPLTTEMENHIDQYFGLCFRGTLKAEAISHEFSPLQIVSRNSLKK